MKKKKKLLSQKKNHLGYTPWNNVVEKFPPERCFLFSPLVFAISCTVQFWAVFVTRRVYSSSNARAFVMKQR